MIIKVCAVFYDIDRLETATGSTSIIETSYAADTATVVKQAENINNANSNVKADSKDIDQKNVEQKDTSPVEIHSQQITNITNSEIKLLQELANRRKQLDETAESIKIREQVLKATEDKVDTKMEELKALQEKVSEVMKLYNEKEHNKIMNLVKIYENMQPKEAAKIFDELEMPILVQVITKMKGIKAAAIIQNMDKIKARDLSIELAKAKSIVD